MASKKDEAKTTAAELETIEVLQERLNVKDWIFAGLKRAHRWGAGLRISERDFQRRVDEFAGAPMGRIDRGRRAR